MTNEEIKKGLTLCASANDCSNCNDCPDYANCVSAAAYNLITEQEKDIKQLKTECALLDDELRNARQDTINVLNKLKEYIDDNADYIYKSECGEYAKVNITLVLKHIDERIKELVKNAKDKS